MTKITKVTKKNPHPFVKWAGGKRQLSEIIRSLIPNKYNTYFEPLIGGGAILFELLPRKAVINDYNKELINTYEVIRDFPNKLITLLQIHSYNNSEEYFYEIRSMDRSKDFNSLSSVQKAARFIYLNKTCFNGLYRVNRSNQFNVPYGRYKNPNIVDSDNIKKCSEYFNSNDIKILDGDYQDALKLADEDDFIYLDPPYVPISKTSSFTSYTDIDFIIKDQIELKNQCDLLTKNKIKFLLSNSHNDFIIDLYKDYEIIEVNANRSINSNSSKRGEVKEVLIRNYGDN